MVVEVHGAKDPAALNELQAVRGPLGLGIERDLHWTPRTLREVRPER